MRIAHPPTKRSPVRSARALPRALAAAGAICLLATATATAARADTGCPGVDVVVAADQDPRPAEAATLCLLNAQRAAAAESPLAPRATLRRAASDFSAEMVRGSFFAHRAPGGPELQRRLATAGYLGRAASDWVVGENLAWAQGAAATPRGIVDSWMASPGHRRNILDRRFRDIGIGVAAGTPGAPGEGITMTTDFGARRVGAARRRGRGRGRGLRGRHHRRAAAGPIVRASRAAARRD
jgi:uncharacterized protein YkwD